MCSNQIFIPPPLLVSFSRVRNVFARFRAANAAGSCAARRLSQTSALNSHTLILCSPLLSAHLSAKIFSSSSGTCLPFKTPSRGCPPALRPRQRARSAAHPSKHAGRREVLAAGAFRGVKHEMMLRWRPSDLLERPGRDVPRLSSVSFPRRRIRTSLLIKLAAAASCSLPDLKAPSAPSADVSPTDARPEKQDEGSVSCHGNGHLRPPR